MTTGLPCGLCVNRPVIPRHVQLKVTLKLLSWYLRDNLPRFLPDLFAINPKVTPLAEQGWSNNTFLAYAKSGERLIVKMKRLAAASDNGSGVGTDLTDFQKEAWIMSNIPQSVPVPKILRRGIGTIGNAGEIHQYAFMVQTRIPFSGAHKSVPESARKQFLQTLGVVGREINSVKTKGFGRKFNACTQGFEFATWSEFVKDELRRCNVRELVNAGILSEEVARRAEASVLSVCKMSFSPTLFHGDFIGNWENVLVDSKHEVMGIIDWEYAGAGPAVHCELAVAWYVPFRDGKNLRAAEEELNAVCAGYGISRADFEANYRNDVESILLCHTLSKLQRYLGLRQKGVLDGDPWRVRFFENAKRLAVMLAAK